MRDGVGDHDVERVLRTRVFEREVVTDPVARLEDPVAVEVGDPFFKRVQNRAGLDQERGGVERRRGLRVVRSHRGRHR